ncbi:unnamed protein product [Echinostoma caproni]|uniref:SBF2 domain-containing protein n=1 Tax=Echinostoma caproni TaxID=27848 RepID=A0A183ABR0_9TREM|nr:unnamed protein product [Echinostoma caproni]
MSFGNFLRRLSFDTEKSHTGPHDAATEGTSSINSIFAAPGKLIESVNVKTGNLVSDLNQKLDLGGKLDSLKHVSVNKFENVVWGTGTGSKDESGHIGEEKTFSSPSKTDSGTASHTNPFDSMGHVTDHAGESSATERRDSQEKAPLRRQSTNAGPRPPRPPPPTAAALSRAMSVDQANIAMNYGKDSKSTKGHPMPGTLEEDEDRTGAPRTRDIEEDDDASSASEYGAYGDKPVYKQDDGQDTSAAKARPTDDLLGKGDEHIEEKGVTEDRVESVINVCVPALINGTWNQVPDRETELQDILTTSIGRTMFVNRIEQESVRTQGQLDTSALPALLDKISLLLTECEDAEDFAPAKKILTVSLLFYVIDPGSPGDRTFLFNYIKSQPIWQSLRFWNACFFQSVQEARAKITDQSG